MTPMVGVGAHVASATVDCDTDGQAIYRATATCHVAITSPLEGEVTYTNIVSRYHVGHRVGLTQARIVEIWKRLENR